MQKNLLNLALFAILASGVGAGWWYVDKTYFPKPEPKPVPPRRETLMAITGAAPCDTPPALGLFYVQPVPPELLKDPVAPPPVAVPSPKAPPTLIALGDDASYTKVLLTTRGGGLQQLTLTRFDEANRLGLEVKKADGQPQPLRLIPGVLRPRDPRSLATEAPFPTLVPGPVANPDLQAILDHPSYTILHYPAKDDPIRNPDEATTNNDDHPSTELAERNWTVAEESRTDDGGWKVAFETELGAPYFLKLRKTFALSPKTYHVDFGFEMIPLPGRTKGKGIFKYQIAGARGLPVEGEWYTATYRNAMIGWRTPSGGMKRSFEDASSIYNKAGGDKVPRGEHTLTYASVSTQYFASAIAVDNTAPKGSENPWEYARPTREPRPWDTPDQPFLCDITVRAVSAPVDLSPGTPVLHKYVIYDGPVKVGLLNQMVNGPRHPDWEVDPALVARYQDALTLRTLADYHSPNFFGRLANAIFWADVVIFFTNLMHSILGLLHTFVPWWGLDIVLLTVMVRLMLLYPSRRQQMSMMRMQEATNRLKPEIDKLHEKYKDDFHAFNQAKTQLMMKNGVNPMAAMGGCVMMFAQMPILMGLYFCLMESVFFRLDPFLWIPNLAAPDMLIWWSEKIPFISTPDGLGGALYLGPFFNVLPLLSVGLIFIHQKITLPPPTDEQQAMQQKMMKMMVGVMALFFYKVAAGLCIYFICGTLWALGERLLLPKPKPKTAVPTTDEKGAVAASTPTEPEAKPGTGFMARLRDKIQEKIDEADQQSKRQIRNDPPTPKANGDARRDKKKKKRK